MPKQQEPFKSEPKAPPAWKQNAMAGSPFMRGRDCQNGKSHPDAEDGVWRVTETASLLRTALMEQEEFEKGLLTDVEDSCVVLEDLDRELMFSSLSRYR